MLRALMLGMLLAFVGSINAQVNLKFCVEVAKDGNCQSESSKFLIGKDGGTISFLLRNSGELNLTDIHYKIFKVDSLGAETFTTAIDQKVEKNWNFAWQDAVFYDPGDYRIKVYNSGENKAPVCVNNLTLLLE